MDEQEETSLQICTDTIKEVVLNLERAGHHAGLITSALVACASVCLNHLYKQGLDAEALRDVLDHFAAFASQRDVVQ